LAIRSRLAIFGLVLAENSYFSPNTCRWNKCEVAMQKTIYELKPWFCITFAATGLVLSQGSKLGSSSALILLGCGLLILQWRFDYRKQFKKQRY
jgi:hypothetical protein